MPIILAQYCIAATATVILFARPLRLLVEWGIFAVPIGKAGQIRSANTKFSWIFFIRCTLSIGRVRVAGPIVLAQHKGNKRIGEVRRTVGGASPIVIEIAY